MSRLTPKKVRWEWAETQNFESFMELRIDNDMLHVFRDHGGWNVQIHPEHTLFVENLLTRYDTSCAAIVRHLRNLYEPKWAAVAYAGVE